MRIEQWKDIIAYEGLYQISSRGRIKSSRRRKNNGIMNGYLDKQGYPKVCITVNYEAKHFLIHRLVAQAFIPNPENKPEVNHLDGNKENNHVPNLEWCTPSENCIHALKIGLRVPNKGENQGSAKLDKNKVREIRRLGSEVGYNELGRMFNVNSGTIHDVISRRTWKHI